MSKMKIGLYLDSVVTGGTFQYNLSILDAFNSLPKDRIKTVITYSSDLWDSYLKTNKIPATKIKRTIFSRIWFQIRYPLWFWRNLGKYFDSFSKSFINQNCDLWLFPSQDIWSYCLPIKSMTTVLDLMHRYGKLFPEAASKQMFKKREYHYSSISKYAESILVDSKIGKNQMIESYNTNPQKIYILPYVAPQYIYNNNNNNVNIYKLYRLPKKYFFYPAQFWLHKNHLALIEAISIVKKRYSDIFLVLVGSKKNGYESVIRSINKYNLSSNIKILDYVPNEHMPELYKGARAMIMPTFYGPTNIPPLEAMALGCPVAISNIYSMPEQVGDAGLLFNPHSVNEIMQIVTKLWIDDGLVNLLRKKGLEKSNEWQQTQFNERFHSIIRQTIGK